MRRVVALTAVLATLGPAPFASAQDEGPEGRPIVGAGSPNDAPLLEPGTYADSVRPTEISFYTVRVAPGQRLSITAVIDEALRATRTDVAVFAPAGNAVSPVESDLDTTSAQDQTRATAVAPPAATLEEAVDAGRPAEVPPAGVWTVAIGLYPPQSEDRPVRQYDMTLEVEVDGSPTAQPAPSVPARLEPAPAPAPDTADPPGRAGGKGERGHSPGPSLALVLPLGAAAGLALGAGLQRWARR